MSAAWFDRITAGLAKTREQLGGHLNVLLRRGPAVDEDFWSDLEDSLIAADLGITAVRSIVSDLRRDATRLALPDAAAVISHLAEHISDRFPRVEHDPLDDVPSVVLVVGINGTGKTTTVGKLAKAAAASGRRVLIGSADTYRAAAIEQLHVWAQRAGVPIVERERGADPAAVAYDTVKRAVTDGVDLTLIDTAGRLHTSKDLMEELKKVKRIADRESPWPVRTVLVLDATTGQNGLVQAREFHAALGLDGIIVTKLDGTAKGGIVVAIATEFRLPILRLGVGEGVDDLQPFDPHVYASALIGSD